MKIIALQYFLDKFTPVNAESLTLDTVGGIVGDCHYGPGDRQVALFSVEAMREIAEDPEKGLCFKRYKPNILMEGFLVKEHKKGSTLTCGDAELEITGYKECFPDKCPLSGRGIVCPLQRSVAFARVVKDGTVKLGDEAK